ncbi:MAG: sugar phosphate nucleotidyltransferase [Candidatus Limnocylindrales bacterium]
MYAVIMAGGGGTRLWPLSRAARPKPFLPLTDERTLLQATVERLVPLVQSADVYVVADGRYTDLIREQLPDLPIDNIVTEPVGRNTAAAVALAALSIDRPSTDVMVVLPADHAIGDEAGFRRALAAAKQLADEGRMVTLGIRATGPETSFGYVMASGEARVVNGLETFAVERFVEKPDAVRAAGLLTTGRAHWNGGIFAWQRGVLLTGLERHAADVVDPIKAGLAAGDLGMVYPSIRSTSIDFALLEPASMEGDVVIIPTDLHWSDVGSWAALLTTLGEPGAVVSMAEPGADSFDLESHDVLVHAGGGRLVVTIGLDGVVVVDTPDAVLVCAADRTQDVKKIVDRLMAERRQELL